MSLLTKIFPFLAAPTPATVAAPVEQKPEPLDPLDAFAKRKKTWADLFGPNGVFLTAEQFQTAPDSPLVVGDSASTPTMDACGTCSTPIDGIGWQTAIPDNVLTWYIAASAFPGYATLGMIATHWLVDKACSMPAEDAARHGYELSLPDYEGDTSAVLSELANLDKRMDINAELTEAARFCNIFGVRLCIFIVESDDPDYYTKPFNPDGVVKGSYKGISQVDAQWIMPQLTMRGSSDPAAKDFYEPEYWVISGKRYHRSHLVILRGPQPPDVLKPTFLFGGISLVQRIWEHVYDAERTSAEAPRLAMAKRTTSLKVDLSKMALKQQSFEERLLQWIGYRDNFSVKVLGKDEELNESDTSLNDLDEVIMSQYQIVAAVAKIPSMKLLGTSPKGFNTGAEELTNYHEELESIQNRWYDPILTRHYLLSTRSLFGAEIAVDVAWNPVASMSAEQLSNVNKAKTETGAVLINAGVISPAEERDRLRADKHSGYALAEDSEEPAEPLPLGQPTQGEPEEPAKAPPPPQAQGKGANPDVEGELDQAQMATGPVRVETPITSVPPMLNMEDPAAELIANLSLALRRLIEEAIANANMPKLGGGKVQQFEQRGPSPGTSATKPAVVAPTVPHEVSSAATITPEKLAPAEPQLVEADTKKEHPELSDPLRNVGIIEASTDPTSKAGVTPTVKGQ